MRPPSHADAFEVLCLQAASDGRGASLFGESLARARSAVRPFMVGEAFPEVYFEHPLGGDPFLDVTVLYTQIEQGTRVASDAARGSEAMLDWFAGICSHYEGITCGFELDTSKPSLPAAAVHFQTRTHIELVEPFCAAIGEPLRAKLYLDQSSRMPDGWSLSYFGLFRGRPGSPLRICGYLAFDKKSACSECPARIAEAFETIGFARFDQAMLQQIAQVMQVASNGVDFQFDVYPDGTIGDTFSLDVQLKIKRPEVVRKSFSKGVASRVMGLLEEWGIADERWRLVPGMAFARAIPVELGDGTMGRYSLTLMPHWVKVRWQDGVLQPAKLYHLGKAGMLSTTSQSHLA